MTCFTPHYPIRLLNIYFLSEWISEYSWGTLKPSNECPNIRHFIRVRIFLNMNIFVENYSNYPNVFKYSLCSVMPDDMSNAYIITVSEFLDTASRFKTLAYLSVYQTYVRYTYQGDPCPPKNWSCLNLVGNLERTD
jgi:hypothetical protein